MERREETLRLWFDMWLQKRDLGISRIFSEDAVYVESWGPEYRGREEIRHWFEEWNRRGTVLVWDVRQFFHQGSQTAVEWYFANRMEDGREERFDGMSLVQWTQDGRICLLKEFGCNVNRYDPYRDGETPCFRDESALWF